MSRQATDYFYENLPRIRRATWTLENGKVRTLGESGVALLGWLCNQCNQAGTVFMTQLAMCEGTGIGSTPEVSKLLTGLEMLGYLTRTGELIRYHGRGKPTPEYALTLVPGLWSSIDSSIDSLTDSGDNRKRDQIKPGKENRERERTELEPQPEPQRSTEELQSQEQSQGDRGEIESALETRHRLLVDECIRKEGERYNGTAGQPLRNKWRAEHTRIVADLLADFPDKSDTWLSDRALEQREKDRGAYQPPRQAPRFRQSKTGEPVPITALMPQRDPKPPTGNPECQVCEGNGYTLERDPQGVATTRRCNCSALSA